MKGPTGILRTWLVIAVLWLGNCGYSFFADWPQFGPIWIPLENDPVRPGSFKLPAAREVLLEARQEAELRYKDDVRQHIFRTATRASLPPIATFAFGWAFLWLSRFLRK
jgi:hypothetical protein